MSEKFGVQDRRDLPVFIHSELDDFGLTPYEFRVYARLVRRAGSGGTAYESVPNVAKATRMGERKVRYALKVLCALGLIGLAEARQGETSVYTVLDKIDWCSRSDVARLRDETLEANPEKAPKHKPKDTPAPGAAPPLHDMQPTPAPGAAKGTPLKALPLEGSPKEIVSSKPETLLELYNSEKPPAWKVATALNLKRRRALTDLLSQHGSETLKIFRAALVYVCTSEWWSTKDFTLDTLLAKNRVLEFAEKAQGLNELPGLSEADRRILRTAEEMYAAIGGDDA